jgi:hypothetical protein
LLQGFHVGDTSILAAASAVWPPLVIRFRLQCDSEPLDSYRIAGFIEPNSCNSNAGVIGPGGQSREQVEFTIRATNGSRIQDNSISWGLPGSGSITMPSRFSLNPLIKAPRTSSRLLIAI